MGRLDGNGGEVTIGGYVGVLAWEVQAGMVWRVWREVWYGMELYGVAGRNGNGGEVWQRGGDWERQG